MPKAAPNPHQQLIALLTEVLAVARTLAPATGPMPPRSPSIAKCKAAQKAYRAGQPIREGTKARVVHMVRAA